LNQDRQKPQILLTNDDGIQSPGLWAAAEALESLGFVHVAAPRDQFSGAGRSLPVSSDGIIQTQIVKVNEKEWTVHSIGGTPAQAVLHAVLEIIPRKPDLVVSGINYGENVGSGITVSGTVGAAMEAASLEIPSLAISLETDPIHHLSYSTEVAFHTAAHFAAYFGGMLLNAKLPPDVHLLKVDIPADATPETPWEITRLSKNRYFEPLKPERESWSDPGKVGYRVLGDARHDDFNSDVYALRVKKIVSVTPISLDMTSRVDLEDLERYIRRSAPNSSGS
jgi:5'-nucleotidase